LERGQDAIMDQLLGLAPILLMFVAMWFILIRPAKKKTAGNTKYAK